jgi:hypothetical protein
LNPPIFDRERGSSAPGRLVLLVVGLYPRGRGGETWMCKLMAMPTTLLASIGLGPRTKAGEPGGFGAVWKNDRRT